MKTLLVLLALLPLPSFAATLNDTCLGSNDASGTTLTCADALSVTDGDLVVCGTKWEGATTTRTVDTGAASPTFTSANDVLHHAANNDLNGETSYWIATSTTTVTPRVVLAAARAFRKLKCYSFTPSGGNTLELGNVAASQETAVELPSAGSAASTAAGVTVVYFHLYGAEALTVGAAGCNSGAWSEAAEFNITDAQVTQYCLQSSAQTLTGAGDFGGGAEDSVGQLAIFNEAAVGGGGAVVNPITGRGGAAAQPVVH